MNSNTTSNSIPPPDDADPLLDSLLEELLGGRTPPDLSSRILSAASQLPAAKQGELQAIPAEHIPALRQSAAHRRSSADRRRLIPTVQWIAGLTAAVAALWLVWTVQQNFNRPGESNAGVSATSVARSPNEPAKLGPAKAQFAEGDKKSLTKPTDKPSGTAVVKTTEPTPVPRPKSPSPDKPLTDKPLTDKSPVEAVAVADPPHSAGNGVFDAEERAAAEQAAAQAAAARENANSADVALAPTSDRAIIDFINLAMRKRYAAAAVTPSAPATDAEWLRRVFLSVIGRIPTLEEFEAFAADRSSDRRASVVDRLLEDGRYSEEYARNWTNVYTVALAGQMLGDSPNDLSSRAGLQQYLRRAMFENKSLDHLATDLITATGATQPGDESYNGATNFLVDKLEDGGIRATAKTAQVFLGIQIQCTQCHNHPFNDWKQSRFWELASFFRQAHTVKLANSAGRAVAQLTDIDFRGEAADANAKKGLATAGNDDAEVYFEERSGRMKAAYPVFFDGTAIPRTGEVARVNRRQELARLMTSSPWFSQAAVNRIWSHFFGYGITRTVDDMGPHNPPSHPELLDRLSRELAAHRYDLKTMIRWIALSEPYALSSRPSRDNAHDDPVTGHAPLFSRYYLRQMRAEQLYESLVIISADTNRSFDARERDKTAWMRQFVISYQTDECDECSLFVGSIPQTLSMMNGELVMSALDCEAPGTLARVAHSTNTEQRKIQQLFAAALGRNPTPTEMTSARRVIASHGDHPAEGLEDLWWALLNSAEFILDR